MHEEAIVFGSGVRLVGVVTTASESNSEAAGTGIIFLNAGLVHRVGPNRLYVNLARALAAQGFTSLRFDHSGIGDSPAADDDRPFGSRFVDEAQQAIDWLAAHRTCRRFVCVGLCSGTLTAFNLAKTDNRVSGLVLLTALLQDPATVPPDVVAEASNRRVARSYTTAKVLDQSTWRKVLTGQANYANAVRTGVRLLRSRAQSRPVDPDVDRVATELRALVERRVKVAFIFAEPTTVLEYFRMTLDPLLGELQRSGQLVVHIIKRADHTFSRLRDQNRVLELVTTWLGGESAKT